METKGNEKRQSCINDIDYELSTLDKQTISRAINVLAELGTLKFIDDNDYQQIDNNEDTKLIRRSYILTINGYDIEINLYYGNCSHELYNYIIR